MCRRLQRILLAQMDKHSPNVLPFSPFRSICFPLGEYLFFQNGLGVQERKKKAKILSLLYKTTKFCCVYLIPLRLSPTLISLKSQRTNSVDPDVRRLIKICTVCLFFNSVTTLIAICRQPLLDTMHLHEFKNGRAHLRYASLKGLTVVTNGHIEGISE